MTVCLLSLTTSTLVRDNSRPPIDGLDDKSPSNGLDPSHRPTQGIDSETLMFADPRVHRKQTWICS